MLGASSIVIRYINGYKNEAIMGSIHAFICLFLLTMVLPATFSIGCVAVAGIATMGVSVATGFFGFSSYKMLRHVFVYEKKVNPLDKPIDLDKDYEDKK